MSNIERATLNAYSVLRPPPDLTVSQWADAYRRLSAEASAEPGRWDTSRAEYQRGILDALSDPDVETIVIMSSAQVGKTEIILNIVGYFVDQDPSPILLLQPTLEMAEAFSKDRLATMVRDTPALKGKISDNRSRDSGNTILHKKFSGGHITMAGANSPSSLASRPIRVVLCDEVDRYPVSAGTEGDPVNLARKRTTTFFNRKIVLTSTPTIKGESRIELAYEQTDQRKYLAVCPHCHDAAELTWDRVSWDSDPSTAALMCKECGAKWSEADRQKAIADGYWQASAEFTGSAGFHLSELYSPWSTPALMAKAFIEAKTAGTELLKTWTNTSLGQTWEEKGEQPDDTLLMQLREHFPDHIPKDVCVLTIGADVQSDRIEYELVGWSADEQSWSIDYEIMPGDPTQDHVWDEFKQRIKERHRHENGGQLSVGHVCVDAGYLTKHVQDFCGKLGLHVTPVIGRSGAGKPVVPTIRQRIAKLRKRRRRGAVSEIIGVDEAKAHIYRRLLIPSGSPKSCHFPDDRDAEYFAQLTAEKLMTKYHRGKLTREWIKTRERNEALDCRVYAYAALMLYGIDKIKPQERVVRNDNKTPNVRVKQSIGRSAIR